MNRPQRRRQTVAMSVLGTLLAATAVAWAAGTTQTERPPKWDRAVLDVFFADARERLGPGGPPIPGQSVVPTTPSGPPVAGSPTATGSASASGAWSKMISPESLEAEVKALVPEVANTVKTQNDFKAGGHNRARIHFSTLATVFGVISEYDGDVRWKSSAAGLRKMFSQAGFNCKTSSDSAYKEAKVRSDELASLIRGGTVETPPNQESGVPWPEVVNRPPLMQRMEVAQRERLKAWTSDSGTFGKNKDAILREAQLLAVLALVIKSDGYEYSDDDTYVEYADELQKHCMTVAEAVKANDFATAQSATSLINKACDACHGDYR